MKSRLLSNVSHEIRTPMNAILGMADVALRDGKKLDSETEKCLNIIKNSSTGLLEIINDILDMSKIEAGRIDILDQRYAAKDLVNDITAIIDARNAEGKVPIYYHIQNDMPPYLTGDSVRIKQVMMNFASNAIKYTESGRIDISLSFSEVDGNNGFMTYTVKDTGIGIRQEDIGEIFEMYSRVDKEKNHSKEGTGIGLAISKYFTEKMNGTISVESEYGKGSTFSFTVPQKISHDVPDEQNADSSAKNTANETNCAESASFVTKDVRILIVDDNEINRKVVKAMLEPFGTETDEAENGAESVEKAASTVYDIIFMDSQMPVMNGEEATGHIRSEETSLNRTTPIVALTADAVSGVRERLLSAGMNDYIVKPITILAITEIVRKYLPSDKIIAANKEE